MNKLTPAEQCRADLAACHIDYPITGYLVDREALVARLTPVYERAETWETEAQHHAKSTNYWRERAERAEAERDACRNLVARLNRDGGHRQQEVGMVQAATEAEERVVEMIQTIATNPAEADVARLRKAIDRCGCNCAAIREVL